MDRDRLLTNLMLYWLTGTAGSAARIYHERAHATGRAARPTEPSTTPTALTLFPAEPQIPPRPKAERTENISSGSCARSGPLKSPLPVANLPQA